jgi:hypothetical protein
MIVTFASAVCCFQTGLAHRLVLSAALRRVPREAVCASLAGKPRQFPRERLSRAMRRTREHIDAHSGYEKKWLWRLNAAVIASSSS